MPIEASLCELTATALAKALARRKISTSEVSSIAMFEAGGERGCEAA
jgi:hypothetical protein